MQAVHSRHFNIERHQIGSNLANSFQRLIAIRRRPRQNNLWIGGKQVAEQLARHRRIVDDQYSNLVHFACSEERLLCRLYVDLSAHPPRPTAPLQWKVPGPLYDADRRP